MKVLILSFLVSKIFSLSEGVLDFIQIYKNVNDLLKRYTGEH